MAIINDIDKSVLHLNNSVRKQVHSFNILNDPRLYVRVELPGDNNNRAAGKFRWIRSLTLRHDTLYGEFFVKDKQEGFVQRYVVEIAKLGGVSK
jgi:hypothetical protein